MFLLKAANDTASKLPMSFGFDWAAIATVELNLLSIVVL